MENLKTIGYFFALFAYVVAIILGIIFAIIAKQWIQLVAVIVLAVFGFFKAKDIYKYLTRAYGTNNGNNNK